MSISGIGMSNHSTSWRKKKTQNNISNTNFALHMAGANITNANDETYSIASGNGFIAGMASKRDTYVRGASGVCAAGVYSKESISATQELDLPIETERYKIEDAGFLEGVEAYSITDKETGRDLSGGQDTNTSSEIIVRPDGSRVLMITVDIGGTQTAMSLQISEPTDMQNDISKQKYDSSEVPINSAALTANDISDSVNEE